MRTCRNAEEFSREREGEEINNLVVQLWFVINFTDLSSSVFYLSFSFFGSDQIILME